MRVTVWRSMAVLGFLAMVGCGGPSATVKGTVTCEGKPVAGGILSARKAKTIPIKACLTMPFLMRTVPLKSSLRRLANHTVVVTPNGVKSPAKRGGKREDTQEFPCDLTPTEWDVKAGPNTIVIELANRQPKGP